jgi:hypothetical protein
MHVNYIRNFGNSGYGNNFSNSYGRPPYAQINYNNRPFIPYPNANERKWKPTTIPQISEDSKKQEEENKTLTEQVASHATMIK